MQTLRFDSQVIWFDESLISAQQVKCAFEAEYWFKQNKIVGSAKGRGTTWFVELDTMHGALRHYRRGGLFGKLVKDHYWFSGWGQTRSAQELHLLQTLIDTGVNVPRPIAARSVKTGLTYQADLLSERIPNARDLVSILQENPLSKMMYQKIGQEIAKMHKVHVNHTDLNIHNILIDDQENIWIIDFDKCFLSPETQFSDKNLERLLRSFKKEKGRRVIAWSSTDFDFLLEGYFGNSNK